MTALPRELLGEWRAGGPARTGPEGQTTLPWSLSWFFTADGRARRACYPSRDLDAHVHVAEAQAARWRLAFTQVQGEGGPEPAFERWAELDADGRLHLDGFVLERAAP